MKKQGSKAGKASRKRWLAVSGAILPLVALLVCKAHVFGWGITGGPITSGTGKDVRRVDSQILRSVERDGRSDGKNASVTEISLEEVQSRRSSALARKDGKALLALGKEIENSKTLANAKDLARQIFEEAAALGDNEAKILAGRYAENGIAQKADFEKALGYYESAGQSGDASGYTAAARMLIAGKIVAVDLKTAGEYIDKAVAMGNNEALFLKGSLMLGQDGSTDSGLALILQAAQANYPEAQMLLGRLYKEGKYVPSDPKQAAAWAEMAAGEGSQTASVDYAKLTLRSTGATSEDAKAALDRLITAADRNEPQAALELARMYRSLSNPTDEEIAATRRYAEVAFDNGQVGGAFIAASTYSATDATQAMAWLKKGAQAADWRSRYAYGLVNTAGLSVQEAISTAAKASFTDFTDFTLVKNAGVSSSFVAPVAVSTPMPSLPSSLSGIAIKGQVTARFMVNQDGNAVNIQIVGSTHPQLEQTVIEAVSKWKFKPATKDGVVSPINLQVPIRFTSNKAK